MLHLTEVESSKYRLFDTVQKSSDVEGVKTLSEIRPLFPWSIAIPVRRHFIETTDQAQPIPPEITGIDELEIGSTFIITGK